LLKTRKRWVALLTAVCMIAAFCVPFVGTASATCSYGLSYVPSVAAGVTTDFTNLYLTVTLDNTSAESLAGSTVVLELPSSPTSFGMTLGGINTTTQSGVFSGATIDIAGTTTGTPSVNDPSTFVSYSVYINNVTGFDTTTSASTSSFSIPITKLYVPGGVSGNVALTAAVPNGSLFAGGSLTLAVAGTGSLTLASESVPAIAAGTNASLGLIDITESMAGALKNNGGDALKLTLPPGITWASSNLDTIVWGSGWPATYPTLTTSNAGRELDISVPVADISTTATFVKLTSTVDIDQSTAKMGNIVVNVSGSATYTPSTMTVGSYGTYAVSDKVLSAPTITAGMAGSTIGEFEVLEGLPGSLLPNRTIDLTLPSNVGWSEVPAEDSANSTMDTLTIQSILAVGSTGNEIEITLGGVASGAGSTPAVIALKNAEVTPAVDFTGPLNVTVGGTEGLTGTISLGTVAAGVTSVSSTTPDVTIGSASASVGDMTITEVAADSIQSVPEYSGLDTLDTGAGEGSYANSSGAFGGSSAGQYFVATNSNGGGSAEIDVWAPIGVTFFNTPTVTVTAGDLQLGTISTNTVVNQGELVIPIKSTSTTASTIKITGTQVTIDRTVPEGPITFKAKGSGVDESELQPNATTATDIVALFPNDTTATQANVANVTTGLNGETAGISVFKIGATSYTLNGNSVNIDVAPYIKDSRTFLPLRYVANALGVADSNIMFDAASQKVTIIKGSMVVQLTIGSTTMLLNGASITMDTAPEITSGRTCLPVAWVAQALNASIAWDATAQTVTITSN